MATNDQTVRQVYSLSDLVLLAGILALGLLFSFMVPGLSGLGYTLLLCLILMVPFWMHGYRITGQEGVFSQKEILVPRECKDKILDFLDGHVDKLAPNPAMNGGALVQIYTRRKDGLILARYFDYADYAAGKEYDLHEISQQKKSHLEEMEDKSRKK